MHARHRDLRIAQHEAAHVVVGLALGLRLRAAVLAPRHAPASWLGYAYFRSASSTAWALTLAAGVAWDRVAGDGYGADDTAQLARLGHRPRSRDALVIAASAILAGRGAAHARVTRALAERDLRAGDIDAIARGEYAAE